MTDPQRARLRALVDQASLTRAYPDLDALARRIETFAAHYATKLQHLPSAVLPATSVSLDGLLDEFDSNPYRVQALLQAMAFLCTPEMLVMLWLAGLGCRIERMHLAYERHQQASLHIELRFLQGLTLSFDSLEIWDFAVLRLVGLGKMDDAPDMSGFYPLPLPSDE